MKVVHITEAWEGGIATYVDTLVSYQGKSKDYSQIHIIYAENRTNVDAIAQFSSKVKLYSYTSSRNPASFLSISREIDEILKTINPDVVHLHSTFPGVYGRLIKRFPTVYCSHGYSFVEEDGYLKKRIYSMVEFFLAKRTEAAVFISKFEENAALSRNIKAMIVNKLIYNGVKDVSLTNNQIPIKVDQEKINIVYIGRLDYKKGFDIVESVFEENNFKNIQLYVIGTSDRDSFSPNLNINNINHLGAINNKDLDSYIKLFDVVLKPSRQEAFGLTAIEAMRNSKAVIASNVGGLPELINDGVNGYLFELANAKNELNSILAKLDKGTLVKLGKAGRKIYEKNFTSKVMCEKITALYKEVLS